MPDTPPKESSVSVDDQDLGHSPPVNDPNAQQDLEAGSAHEMPMFENEVKEQDRWLPIANGWFIFPFFPSHTMHSFVM